ncbi:sensor histidine kinase [Nibrella saemangeumensis]|uniref:histidine kinase n=1 Tax=Nibrella saemangeumensis TaxID=1084526 RepID=A0ABP8MLE3_9BACT
MLRQLLLLGLLLLASPSQSQLPEKLTFDQLNTVDGLPENFVHAMLQDHLGFMWLGTQNGLVRYDGAKMDVFRYDKRNPFSLKALNIRALLEDKNGDVWICGDGLYRFDRTTQHFIDYTPKGKDAPAQTELGLYMHQDRQGQIWTIGWSDKVKAHVLNRLNPKTGQWTVYRNDGSKRPNLTHTAIHFNPYFTGDRQVNLSFKEDQQGQVWVITTDQRGYTSGLLLHRYNRESDRFEIFQPLIAPQSDVAFERPSGVCLDKRGLLWVSTAGNGLFQIHPRTRKILAHYQHQTAPGLANDSILSLYQDRQSNLWLNTVKGLTKFIPSSGTFRHYRHIPANRHTPSGSILWSLREMKNGDMWFRAQSTWGYVDHIGVDFYDHRTDQFTRYKDSPGLRITWGVSTVLEDHSGSVWVNAPGFGLFKQNRMPRFTRYTHDSTQKNTVSDIVVTAIYEAPSEPDVLWLGTFKGLDRWNRKTGVFTHYTHDPKNRASIAKGGVSSIVEDRQKRLWVGTYGGGLCLLNRQTGTFTRFANNIYDQHTISNDVVEAILPARDGSLWVSTEWGLNRMDIERRQFKAFHQADTTYQDVLLRQVDMLLRQVKPIASILHPANKVDKTIPFALTKPGAVLVTAMGELTALNRSDYGWIEDSKGHIVWEMNVARSRHAGGRLDNRLQIEPIQLAAGSYRLRYRTNEWHSFGQWLYAGPDRPDWWGIQVLPLTTSQTEQIAKLVRKSQLNGLLDYNSHCLLQDKKGNIWIGTGNQGVAKYNPATNTFIHYHNQLEGPHFVVSLLEDTSGSGTIWATDYFKGLMKIDPEKGTIKRFTSEQGLPYQAVRTVQQDRHGYIWLGSDNGLSRFDPATGRVQNFNPSQGFPDLRFFHRSTKAPDGTFYFGGFEGFVRFRPDQITTDTIKPKVALTGLTIFNTPVEIGDKQPLKAHISVADEVTLAYDQNDLTFQFVAPHYIRAAQIQYAYRLDGYDKDWSPATTRQARYTDLAPGTYTFQVKAANADGLWSERPTSIKVIIYPPWWHTWWAYVLYAVLLASSLRAYILYRSRTLRRQNRILEEKVSLRTQQIQQQKEEIETQRDNLEDTLTELKATQDQLVQKEKMASLGQLTAGIAHEIQNPLNFVNNLSEVSTELIDELVEEAKAGHTDDVLDIASDLKETLEKVSHHGKRADSIVKGMLQHSRASSGEKQPTDLNALADEYLRLAYHGIRAKDQNFNADLRLNLDPSVKQVNIAPQEIGRVLLNLYNNAFYAVQEKHRQTGNGYQPQVEVTTHQENGKVELRVKDNGTGIPSEILTKIYQPFFTTKPTGQGTGLGLSLSYDIVTKGHGGEMQVETKTGEGTEFIVELPVTE